MFIVYDHLEDQYKQCVTKLGQNTSVHWAGGFGPWDGTVRHLCPNCLSNTSRFFNTSAKMSGWLEPTKPLPKCFVSIVSGYRTKQVSVPSIQTQLSRMQTKPPVHGIYVLRHLTGVEMRVNLCDMRPLTVHIWLGKADGYRSRAAAYCSVVVGHCA